MPFEAQHARNCPAVWRGFYVTLFDRVPEDATCTCGVESRARVGTEGDSGAVTARAA